MEIELDLAWDEGEDEGTPLDEGEALSAAMALVRSLRERGRVDFDDICALMRAEADEARAALGTSVFFDPVSSEWQTAALYLSGNLREKLEAVDERPMASAIFIASMASMAPTRT